MVQRRNFLAQSLLAAATFVALPVISATRHLTRNKKPEEVTSPILKISALGFTWDTKDPFLFCVHHEDAFPKGNDNLGPDKSHLQNRHIGDDFIIKDGFRMYHGKTVPGFPGHPHRGFETITVVKKGIVDHSDSMGASGRYGNGDVQWMTAGQGVQHAEMFPLIHKDKENPMELFQIWLNLPKKDKMVEPHYKMLWKENIGNLEFEDTYKKKTRVEVIAGELQKVQSPNPPPGSWAFDPLNEVAIWNMNIEAGGEFTLPKASAGINRTIYFYEGDELRVADTPIQRYHAVELRPDVEVTLKAGSKPAEVLVLQGKPIGEPVIQYGPFVMNTKEEINQAFADYHKTQFGGWPWPKPDQVHPRETKRFAKYADGTSEFKDS